MIPVTSDIFGRSNSIVGGALLSLKKVTHGSILLSMRPNTFSAHPAATFISVTVKPTTGSAISGASQAKISENWSPWVDVGIVNIKYRPVPAQDVTPESLPV